MTFAPSRPFTDIEITLTPIDHPSLLPPVLRGLMPAKLPEPKKTEPLGAPAWRYGELPVSDVRLLEVTVVPSTVGAMTVACIAPRESWVAALGCAGDIRDARRRRRIPVDIAAERASISRMTLLKLEKGEPGLPMGIYATVLFVLGLADRLADIADPKNDPVGLQLEEEHLPKRIRGPRKPKPMAGA